MLQNLKTETGTFLHCETTKCVQHFCITLYGKWGKTLYAKFPLCSINVSFFFISGRFTRGVYALSVTGRLPPLESYGN